MFSRRACLEFAAVSGLLTVLGGCAGRPRGSGAEPATLSPVAELPGVLPRSAWTDAAPKIVQLSPMAGVNRITVHHTGGQVLAVDEAETALMIESLRAEHVRKKFVDVRFHFIVDPAGRVWEGRSTRFQGALIEDDNAHSLGVACLGDYTIEKPTAPMKASLVRLLALLSKRWNVPPQRVFAACELAGTVSPGAGLAALVRSVRAPGGTLRA